MTSDNPYPEPISGTNPNTSDDAVYRPPPNNPAAQPQHGSEAPATANGIYPDPSSGQNDQTAVIETSTYPAPITGQQQQQQQAVYSGDGALIQSTPYQPTPASISAGGPRGDSYWDPSKAAAVPQDIPSEQVECTDFKTESQGVYDQATFEAQRPPPPPKPTCWGEFKKKPHLRSLILNVLVWCFIFGSCACFGSCGYAGITLYVFTVLAIIFYYIEALLLSSTKSYLKTVNEIESAYAYVDRLKQTFPIITMSVDCYHHETRTRTVHQQNGPPRTETYTVRVTTYSETEDFIYQSWSDVSGPLLGLDEDGVNKIKYAKTFCFGDAQTEAAFKGQAFHLQARNRHRDSCMDYHENVHISDFRPHMLSFLDITKRPKLMTLGWYKIFSLCFLSWPYRVWMEGICTKAEFTFVKMVSLAPPAPQMFTAPSAADVQEAKRAAEAQMLAQQQQQQQQQQQGMGQGMAAQEQQQQMYMQQQQQPFYQQQQQQQQQQPPPYGGPSQV